MFRDKELAINSLQLRVLSLVDVDEICSSFITAHLAYFIKALIGIDVLILDRVCLLNCHSHAIYTEARFFESSVAFQCNSVTLLQSLVLFFFLNFLPIHLLHGFGADTANLGSFDALNQLVDMVARLKQSRTFDSATVF